MLTELVLPVSVVLSSEPSDSPILLGVLLSLKNLLPQISEQESSYESVKGSFGVLKKEEVVSINVDKLLQVSRYLWFFFQLEFFYS